MSDTTTQARPVPRLKQRYHDEIAPALQQQLGLANVMQIPTFEKIVVNVGLGESINDAKALESAMRDLATITGQKARVNRARKSIANFKLREGMAIGASVTLRGDRMWEFLDRLLSVTLPRIRDFRGMKPTSFDGRGNYSFGLVEQLTFAEIDYDSVDTVRGMDITLTTTAENDEQGRALLDAFGFPFVRGQEA